MQINLRRYPRRSANKAYSLCWYDQSAIGKDPNANIYSVEARSIDTSASGIRLKLSQPVPVGTAAFVQSQADTLSGYCVVRHCTPYGDSYAIGLEFTEEIESVQGSAALDDIDFYEFLQISPKADTQTIHRIYRIMASRFHPDNPETGDPEKFMILQTAYKTLADPERRAEYDSSRSKRESGQLPIFELRVFLDGIEGETNRRLGVLALLYNNRKSKPHNPGISLLDLETRMGIPREYLDFTVWYLKSKQYIAVADSSDFTLTALGVDFVESSVTKIPILDRLLQSGPRCATSFRPSAKKTPGFSGTPFLTPPDELASK